MNSEPNNAFMDALGRLDLECVRSLLESDNSLANRQIKYVDNSGKDCILSPLHYAVIRDNAELVQLLLHYGANVNAAFNGVASLHEAHSRKVAGLLLDHGADANVHLNNNVGPLLNFAMIRKRLMIAKLFIERGADVNAIHYEDGDTIACIHGAIKRNRLEFMELLLDNGVDVNVRTERGRTPLYYALFCGSNGWPRIFDRHDVAAAVFPKGSLQVDAARLLLRRGADVNAKDNNGYSLFFSACEYGYLDVVQLLLDHGGPEAVLDGDLALVRAAEANKVETIQFLLNNGIDVNCLVPSDRIPRRVIMPARCGMDMIRYHHGTRVAKNEVEARKKYGSVTPLLLACHYKNLSALQMLLRMGADVNMGDLNGCTPIAWASLLNNWDVVKILINHGADVNPASLPDGRTPLSLACMENEGEVVLLLLDSGARVDYTNGDGSTPLLCSVMKGRPECATMLLKRGADINAGDREEVDTPFLLGCQFGSIDIIYRMIRFSPHHRRPQPYSANVEADKSIKPFCCRRRIHRTQASDPIRALFNQTVVNLNLRNRLQRRQGMSFMLLKRMLKRRPWAGNETPDGI